ncbi:MAG: S26 family signal peptidase [Nocardioides sp.]
MGTARTPPGPRADRPPGTRWGIAIVHGRSMVPTLRAGDRLLVIHGGTPRAGGLVVVRFPEGVVAVKRAARRVPGGWWVEADNPVEGVDSRQLGVVREEDVVARVLLRLWPFPRPL